MTDHTADLCHPDNIACPRCPNGGGQIALTEWLTDTLTEHKRKWVCTECLATGTLTLTLTITNHRQHDPPTPRIRYHRDIRA